MYSLEEVTESLKRDRATLVENLNAKGVEALEEETFTSLSAKVADIPKVEITNASYLFYDGARNDMVDILCASITSSCTKCTNMFYNNQSITEIPYFNSGNCTGFSSVFYGCSMITTIPLLDTSSSTYFISTFENCNRLIEIPQIDVSNGTSFKNMFRGCGSLRKVPSLNTVKGTDFSGMFQSVANLRELGMLDMSSATNLYILFDLAGQLTTVGGFKDLGKAYDTTKSANYNNYTLDMSSCSSLTYQSAMNVINNLYDIASLGCQPQRVRFRSRVMELLSEEEVAIATNKGWNVTT